LPATLVAGNYLKTTSTPPNFSMLANRFDRQCAEEKLGGVPPKTWRPLAMMNAVSIDPYKVQENLDELNQDRVTPLLVQLQGQIQTELAELVEAKMFQMLIQQRILFAICPETGKPPTSCRQFEWYKCANCTSAVGGSCESCIEKSKAWKPCFACHGCQSRSRHFMKTTEAKFNKTLEKLAILRAQINFQCLNLFNKENK
jgi:hypothetical protein